MVDFAKINKAKARRANRIPKQAAALYQWVEVQALDGVWYSFNPDVHVDASIKPAAGQWEMRILAHGQRYKGTRPTLEDAYKAASDLLFKVAKPYWLKQDAKAVMAPWAHTLPED